MIWLYYFLMRKSFATQPALFATHDLLDHPALSALDGIESLIDWSVLEALLPKGKGETGRLGYASLTLFRALLLGLWHDLSDVKLEAQLARDLMFRKFCRLELDQGVPQASTIGRFRISLEKSGRLEAVLTEINAQLCAQNVILQEGRVAIVDETVVEAAQSGIRKGDPEAGSHVKVNPKGKMQAKWGYRNRKLSVQDRARNIEIVVTRGRVGVIFGHMKRLWGMARSRFIGLARTHTQFQIAAIGWNLQKGTKFRQMFG